MNKKTIIGIGLGCVVICLILGCVVLGFSGYYMKRLLSEPEGILVDVRSPMKVNKGENFTLEIQITNTGNSTQELTCIDLDSSYLEGVIVKGTNPDYVGFDNNDLIESMAFQSYYFKQEIPTGETITIQFTMQALKSGDYSGTIDTCINTETNCLENYVRTIVE